MNRHAIALGTLTAMFFVAMAKADDKEDEVIAAIGGNGIDDIAAWLPN